MPTPPPPLLLLPATALPALGGRSLTVRPLTRADAGGAAVLVARAFAAAGSAPLGDVAAFVDLCLAGDAASPAGLVAELAMEGEGAEDDDSLASALNPLNKPAVLVGFAAVAGPGRAAVDRAAADAGAPPTALPPGAAVLTNVAVHPAARRAGVGRSLVAAAEGVARAAGAAGLWLEPRGGGSGAAARALYAAAGYEPAEAGGDGGSGGGLGALLGRLTGERRPGLLVKRF